MQIPKDFDSECFYLFYLEGKSEEEIEEIGHYLEKKIKVLEKEIKLRWKYGRDYYLRKERSLQHYREYLWRVECTLSRMRGEPYNEKSGELAPLIEILKARQENKNS